MDQKFVSGLGNIYVNEILFLSGIKPSSEVKKLKDYKIKNYQILENNFKKINKTWWVYN